MAREIAERTGSQRRRDVRRSPGTPEPRRARYTVTILCDAVITISAQRRADRPVAGIIESTQKAPKAIIAKRRYIHRYRIRTATKTHACLAKLKKRIVHLLQFA